MLSFRLLASRVLARTGGAADGTLDAGGKLLMMQRALQEALPSLTVYARPSRKAPFLAELVALCDELQVCRVEPERLGEVWSGLGGLTGEKVRDLSLIYAAYLHRLKGEGQDRRDLMTRLGEELEASGYAEGKDVFLDGFTYFTAQELAVIAILLRRARSVTITLLGERDSDLEIFRQSLRARDPPGPPGGQGGGRVPGGLPPPPVRRRQPWSTWKQTSSAAAPSGIETVRW